MRAAYNLNKVLVSFSKYGNKVIEMVNRKEPKATFSMRFLMSYYGCNIPASVAADKIIKAHQDKIRKKREKSKQ